MKKSVYITGISCAILMLFGCVAKVMHWPGASVMLILSVFLFCFWFLPTALKNSYDQLPLKKMKTLHIISYLVFAVCMMGVLFKVMHWPGAAVFLLVGILSPFVIFLPVYLYHTHEEEKTGNKNFLGLVLGLTFLAVFSVFLALSVSRPILYYAAQAINNNETTIKALSSGPKDSEVSKAADELFVYTDDLKCILLNETTANMCDGNKTNANYSENNISEMQNREMDTYVFLNEGGVPRVKILKEKIDKFRETVLASKNTSPELTELVNTLFDTSDNDINGIYPPGIAWEKREFNYSVLFMLDFLSKLQSHVRLVEGEALK